MGNSREPHSRPHSHAEWTLIVVDEPTAELDRESASAVIEALRVATAHGATFVIATHDPEVTAIADHVIDLTQRVEHRAATIERPAAQDQDVVLTTTSLSKSYGEVHAVVDASIEVRAGQLAVIVGRSGSGKSTLLMLLGGWSEPDAGTIGGVTSRAWADCAYVPQRFGLVPELTVAENVELPARGRANGAEALLARLALAELRDRYPAEISIGQQQRVAVVRALVLGPRLLLVDEPTSHQDPGIRRARLGGLDRRGGRGNRLPRRDARARRAPARRRVVGDRERSRRARLGAGGELRREAAESELVRKGGGARPVGRRGLSFGSGASPSIVAMLW